jgi:peptide/nickel transport system substrate-binding protein
VRKGTPMFKCWLAAIVIGAVLGGCTKVDTAASPAATTAATSVAATVPATAGTDAASGAPGTARHAWTIPHTLRFGDIQDVTSLNPHLVTAVSLNTMSELTMAYLARYDHANRPTPELATEIPSQQNRGISPDGLTITWHLRHGVKWSDGIPFDADDVVFSTNAVNNPANNEIGRDGWELITKVDEPDKFTVVYHLKKPYSSFMPVFFGSAGANPCILPKHLLGKLPNINHADYNSLPVGIGPFRYVRWVRGDHVEMEANPYYWRGKPKLQKIIYKFIPDYNTLMTQLQTGEVDLWPYVGLGFYDRAKALPNVTTIHKPGYLYTHLDFNGAHAIFADKAVREALRYALDRPTLRAKIQHGLGILQEAPTTPVSPFYTAFPAVPFDIAKANAVLDAAGWKRGSDGVRAKNGQRLAFNYALTTGQPDADQEVELIRTTWQQIGAQINVQHYPSALMFAPRSDGGIIYSGKFDMVLFSWQLAPDGDLSGLFGCDFMPPKGQNVLHYCDRKNEAQFAKAKATYDVDGRKPEVAAIQKNIIDDIPKT